MWALPAVRCMQGITFRSGKVIPQTDLYSELESSQLVLLY